MDTSLIMLIFKIATLKLLEDIFLILCAFTFLPLSFHQLKKTQNEVWDMSCIFMSIYFLIFEQHRQVSIFCVLCQTHLFEYQLSKGDHNHCWIRANYAAKTTAARLLGVQCVPMLKIYCLIYPSQQLYEIIVNFSIL